jgi:peptidoglycan/LPS O-acetylase OafA/YrhL
VLGAAIAFMALLHETIASRPMVIYGYTIIAVFYAVTLVLAVTAPDGDVLGRALRWRWLGTIGTVAYAIYLVHLPMLGVSSLIVDGGMRIAVLGMVLTLALAAVSWRYFERPLVRVGHRYAYE